MSLAAQQLRHLLGGPDLLVCPVVGDPLTARLVQQAGLPMALLGGFGIAASRFALPDTGLITFTDVLDQVRNTCAAVPGFPIVADGDNGYGNAMNVRRTVQRVRPRRRRGDPDRGPAMAQEMRPLRRLAGR